MTETDATDYSNWPDTVIHHGSTESFFKCPNLASGIHAINLGLSHLDVLLRKTNSKTLLVVFGGAVNRNTGVPPFFSGLGLTKLLPVSLLSFSDPALTADKNIRIGWYTGLSNEQAEDHIARIIDHIAQKIGAKKVILLGGSAGGFASLLSVTKLQCDSEAFVMNPQTDIEKYHHRHSVEEWRRVCAVSTVDLDRPNYPTTNLVKHYSSIADIPKITYFQNSSDTHKNTHALPFRKIVGDSINYVEEDWGEGHVPPPPSLLASYVLPSILPTPLAWILKIIGAKRTAALLESVRLKVSS